MMEEDDEIRSPRTNGRITVTVAVPMPNSNNGGTLTLALPSSQVRGSGGGREDCWSESATAVLIEAWGERYLELSRGNLKQKHWREVADIVSSREDYGKLPKTDIQCKNRIDTVKKKYKLEKSKMVAGGPPSKWPFFDKLDHLIGAAAKDMAKNHKIPKGMPVGHLQQLQKGSVKKRGQVEWDSDSSRELSPVSADSFPPPKKRPRMAGKEIRGKYVGKEKKESGGWGNSMRELTQAMLRFGEAYENAETAKLQQVVEMEKQRMKFAKELELQRMHFFTKTQLEISQRNARRNGNATNRHRSS